MKKRNLLKSALFVGVVALGLSSCKDKCEDVTCQTGYVCQDGECVTDPNATVGNEVKTGKITANETWTADKIYEIKGRVIVDGGATLTIEPGTIIKGQTGEGASASALVVARGAKIMAKGTAAKPIIFTSVLDNIKIGEKTGTNLKETDTKKWGGVVILGNAKISAKNGGAEASIEGLSVAETYGKYGGTNDADNSGVFTYVSIRHGGIAIAPGNEINGLTLGGVGNGTKIENVEVVATLDDGIECFGGSVNIKNALVAYQGDDALDVDQNYSGTFDNAYVVYNNTGDEFMEIDGPEKSNVNDQGLFTIQNSTFVSKTNDGTVDLKSKAQGTIKDCKFVGLKEFKLSASFENDCVTGKTDAYDRYTAATPKLKVTGNNTDAGIKVYTKSEDNAGTKCTLPASYQTNADNVFNAAGNGSTATGANKSVFDDWTWTAINNKF